MLGRIVQFDRAPEMAVGNDRPTSVLGQNTKRAVPNDPGFVVVHRFREPEHLVAQRTGDLKLLPIEPILKCAEQAGDALLYAARPVRAFASRGKVLAHLGVGPAPGSQERLS